MNKIFLSAPMAGVTDKPFRHMLRLFGKQPLFTEMVGADSLARQSYTTRKMMQIADEENIIVQLVGANPETMAYAAEHAAFCGAVGVDINMGCPVKKLISNGSGAALMKNPDKAACLVEAVKKAVSLPVSVKMRAGWDAESINAVSFAYQMQEAGADRITVHGRTRMQGYAGQADWDLVRRVKETVRIPVILNGDIVDYDSANRAFQTGVDGVMLGRGLLGKPWMLTAAETGIVPDYVLSDMVQRHFELLLEYYGRKGLYIARKHIAWYARGKKGVAPFCQRMYAETEAKKVSALIKTFFKEEGAV